MTIGQCLSKFWPLVWKSLFLITGNNCCEYSMEYRQYEYLYNGWRLLSQTFNYHNFQQFSSKIRDLQPSQKDQCHSLVKVYFNFLCKYNVTSVPQILLSKSLITSISPLFLFPNKNQIKFTCVIIHYPQHNIKTKKNFPSSHLVIELKMDWCDTTAKF